MYLSACGRRRAAAPPPWCAAPPRPTRRPAAPSSNMAPDKKRPLGLVDMLNLPTVGAPTLSPDGQAALFVVARSDWAPEIKKRVPQVWRTGTGAEEGSRGAAAVQLTRSAGGASSPLWSPDSSSIAFVSKRQGDESAQLYILPAAGGEARRLT
jgi:dipeptidyl aminopeptidase/acylaminoacyl peptidase